MKKKMISFISLILAISLLLASCGPASSGGGGQANGDKITDPTTIEKKDWREKYDPAIEVSVVNYDMPYLTFSQPGDSVSKNNWTRAYEEEFGIKTNYLWTCDNSQFQQKIEMTIASGELPDILQVNAAQLQSLVEQGLVEDLSKVFLEYASDDLRDALEQAGPTAIETATFDGKLMALPNASNAIESVNGLWIRTDWLDKLGLKMPTTMKEFEEVLMAFAQKDPDGNGKADTFSFDMNKQLFNNTTTGDGIAFGYNAYPNTWIEKDGKVVFGGVQPEMKEALAAYKRLYDAGAINKEFATIDAAKANEAIINDKVGAIFGGYYASSALRPMVTATKKTDIWRFVPIPNVTPGAVTKPPHDTAPFGYYVVKKGYANPEVAIKFANMFVDEFYVNSTDQERYYKFCQNETGTNPIWSLALCQVYRPLNNINNFRNLDKAINGGDKSAMDKVTFLGKSFYNGGITFRDKKGTQDEWITNWFWWVMHCPEYPYAAMRVSSDMIEKGNITPNMFNGMLTTAMAEKYGFLIQKQSQEFQKFIIGERSLDDWDKYVEEFNSMGGKEVTDSINEWYTNKTPTEDNVFFTTWKK